MIFSFISEFGLARIAIIRAAKPQTFTSTLSDGISFSQSHVLSVTKCFEVGTI